MIGAPSATGGRAKGIETKETVADRLRHTEYKFSVTKYLHEEIEVNRCVLKSGGDVIELLFEFETVRYLTKRWRVKVHKLASKGTESSAHRRRAVRQGTPQYGSGAHYLCAASTLSHPTSLGCYGREPRRSLQSGVR